MKPNRKKTALVTGATSGIGAAYADALAEKGYDLILTGRRSEVINEVAERIRKKFQTNVSVVIVELSEVIGID